MSLFIATCGPTGIGKTFQMQRLINSDRRRFTAVLSVTTRPRRGPEDGERYRFVSHDDLAHLDSSDVISDVVFRDERYVLLRSEIDKALARAPIAFMAIVPSVIMLLRSQSVQHSLVCCCVDDPKGYEERLKRRGFSGEAFEKEKADSLSFGYPTLDPAWPQQDVRLGSDKGDGERFDAVVASLAGKLFPRPRV